MPIKFADHRPQKRTKIVATIGPASDSESTLRAMILAGLDVVRFNFSHSKPDYLVPLVKTVRKLSHELNVPVAILGDLRGPRIRVGEIEGGTVFLETGQTIILTPQSVLGNSERVSISFPGLARDIKIGSTLLLDDGDIELVIEKVNDSGEITGFISQGGLLASHRGINLPGQRISLPSVTKKDLADVDFAIEHGFDFLALSFVQSADDVRKLKDYLVQKGATIPIIAKIEKKGGLDEIEAIIQEAYGVMVARGDLALEMSIQEIPVAQKQIINICRQNATPVITATQMLESMVQENKPTRAEATDVANAILDGTDALMLSGETAIGKHPVQTVATMSAIAIRTETAWLKGELAGPVEIRTPKEIDAAVAHASHLVAKSLNARTIITYTTSGSTALRVARYRSAVPILALSSHPATRYRLALTWGVESALVENVEDMADMVKVALQQVQACHLAVPGDTVVITAGTPFGIGGRTNLLKVEQVSSNTEHEETDND